MTHCVSECSFSFGGKIKEKQYYSVLHEYFQQEATQSGLPTFPLRFPLGQKRRKHIQEALVKETVLNDEVEGSEQRGCSLLEEMSVIPPIVGLSYTESRHSWPENEHTAKRTISTGIYVGSQKGRFRSLILSFPSEINYTTIDSRRIH